MKKINRSNYYFALFGYCLLLLLGSCNTEDPECDCDNSTVEVGFVLSAPATVSRGMGTIHSKESANRIDNFQIFIFDESGFLEKTVYLDGTNIDKIVKTMVQVGYKDFYGVANLNAPLEGITNKSQLAQLVCHVETQQAPPFLMVAERFGEKVSSNPEENVFTLTVARLVSRIRLQLETDFKNTYYEDKEFALDSVFITNGNSQCSYSFTQKGAEVSASTLRSGRVGDDRFLDCFVETGRWTTTPVGFYSNNYFYFYVFPNDQAETPTKIVLSALLDGKRNYYPITVNKPNGKVDWGDTPVHDYVKRNTDYKIRVTITGEGSKDPEVDVDYVNISLGIRCDDWMESWQEDDFKE